MKCKMLVGWALRALVYDLQEPLARLQVEAAEDGAWRTSSLRFVMLSELLATLRAIQVEVKKMVTGQPLNAADVVDWRARFGISFGRLSIPWCLPAVSPLGKQQSLLQEIPMGEIVRNTDTSNFLGSGSYGVVMKAAWGSRPIALKQMKRSSEASLIATLKEAQIQASLTHPNVAKLLGFSRDEHTPLALVLELCSKDTLAHRLFAGDPARLPVKERMRLIREVAYAMQYLHGRTFLATSDLAGEAKILHGDLKPGNILLDANGTIKVSDFGHAAVRSTSFSIGLSFWAGEGGQGRRGTVGYQSPECYKGDPLTTRSDVFSFGIVAYEIWTKEKAFLRECDVLAAMVNNTMPTLEFAKEAGVGPEADLVETIIRRCWEVKPENRPSFNDIAAALDDRPTARRINGNSGDVDSAQSVTLVSVRSDG
jgi:serine/threonine protein kinase